MTYIFYSNTWNSFTQLLVYIKSQQVIKGKKLKLIMITDIMNMTWAAEIQILNEDMILALLIVI